MTDTVVINTRKHNTSTIGLMLALSSWALVFITLVWGYVAYRVQVSTWYNGLITTEALSLAVINSVVMIVSSLCLARGIRQNDRIFVWGAIGFGLMFLVGQWQLWHKLLGEGLHWQKSIAGSFFFLLTGFHAAHIAGGWLALIMLAFNLESWQGTIRVRGIRYFWDFLLAVWLVMFGLIFIIQ